MGFIQRTAEKLLWRLIERRSSLENPQTPLSFPAEWLLDIFNGGRTDAGVRVSEMSALQVSTVLSCVNIISNGVASQPLQVYEQQIRDGRLAKKIAADHVLYELLHDEPNPEMTSHTFRRTLQVHMLLWGNGYAEIQRDSANRLVALWPRNPARTRPVRLTQALRYEGTLYPVGTLVYRTNEYMSDDHVAYQDNPKSGYGPERLILAEDMVHLVGLSLDGRLGQSTVELARQVIGLSLATEKYGAKFFGNSAVPRGILEHPGILEPKALETLKRSWHEAHGGENQHKTAVLEQGIKYQPIGTSPNDSQFLETREYQRMEIATIFNVPPHMIGGGEGSKSSVEQTSIEFLNFCLNPWLHTWEQELERKLFSKTDRSANRYIVRFDTHRLLYPTAEARSRFYASGKNWGYLNTNDIHELEDMNPVEDGSGDTYWMPMNMQHADDPLVLGAKAQQKLGGGPVSAPPSLDKALRSRSYLRLFCDAFGRIAARKKPTPGDFNGILLPIIHTLAEEVKREAMIANRETPEIDRAAQEYVTELYRRHGTTDWRTVMIEAVAREEAQRVVDLVNDVIIRVLGFAEVAQDT